MADDLHGSDRSSLEALKRALTPDPNDKERSRARLAVALRDEERLKRPRWWARAMVLSWHVRYLMFPAVLITAVLLGRHRLGTSPQHEANIRIAREHLVADDHAFAYRTLIEDSRMYRTKRAAEDRIPLMLRALCGMGRRQDAENLLESYLERNPGSEHKARAGDVCGRP